VNFKWVNPVNKMIGDYSNVEYIAYEDLYNKIR